MIDWDNVMNEDGRYVCPSCNKTYASFSTIQRHKMRGCPKKPHPTFTKENETFDIPDFDKILNEKEPETPSSENIKEFVNSLDFEEDEEGQPTINLTKILSDSTLLDSIFEKIDESMYNSYHDKTGEEIFSPERRAYERDIFIFILKVNLRGALIAIQPIWALIGFSTYYYGIPLIKLVKSRGKENDGREENEEIEE